MTTDNTISTKLNSTEHLDVALGLTDIMLEECSNLADYKDIVASLRTVRDAIWKNRGDFESKHAKTSRPNLDAFWKAEEERKKVFEETLTALDTDTKKEKFMEAYARMGHLYEMAGLIARDNFFRIRYKDEKKPAPHGAEELITFYAKEKELSCEDIIAQLNKPTNEYVFTTHPTSTNSLESQKIQRDIAVSTNDVRKGKPETDKLKQHIRDFIIKPLTPQDGDKITNMDVAGETQQVLYYLGNAYDDLESTYKRFDSPLTKRFTTSYNPLDLNLKLRFDSWGSSGDKDGNKKVNAQTTLHSMVMHREAILERYVRDVKAINSGQLTNVQATLENELRAARSILNRLEELRVSRQTIRDAEFDDLSAEFTKTKPDIKAFEAELVNTFNQEHENPPKRKNILSLIRRVRTFGDSFGHIEFRETAEEFTRITEFLVDGYDKMSETQRSEALTKIIQNGKARDILNAKIKTIKAGAFDENGNYKPYANPDTKKGEPDTDAAKMPVAYQTLKRLELARDHPEMVVNQVMAECENTSNFLEVKMLMEAVATPEGKKPVLGIVPLFESPEVMKRVGEIMEATYKNPVYKEHMQLVHDTHPEEMEIRDGKAVLTQQIQFAHSDNSRRAGMPAARANIDEGHDVTKAVGEENGVATRYFQGGSLTDPFRGGTRSPTGMISQYGLHNYFKCTVQGGDMLNYFNYPHSLVRMLTRIISHCAKNFDQAIEGQSSEKVSNPIDFLARKALQNTYPDYETMFSLQMLGKVLGESGYGYGVEQAAAKAGTRGQRGGGGEAKAVPFDKASAPIDPDKIRTIDFSELFQHDGITPTWFSIRNLKHQLTDFRAACLEKFEETRQRGSALSPVEQDFKRLLEGDNPHAISPKAIKELYKLSPVFKDIIDRVAYGVSMTDLDAYERNHPELAKEYTHKPKETTIMKTLRSDYVAAARLSICALTGRDAFDSDISADDPEKVKNYATWLREQVRSSLRYGHTIAQKSNYMEFIQSFKQDWKRNHTTVSDKLARICHNALDTVTHGRIPLADDPRYAEAFMMKANSGVAI